MPGLKLTQRLSPESAQHFYVQLSNTFTDCCIMYNEYALTKQERDAVWKAQNAIAELKADLRVRFPGLYSYK